jgi:hypothetical protein
MDNAMAVRVSALLEGAIGKLSEAVEAAQRRICEQYPDLTPPRVR